MKPQPNTDVAVENGVDSIEHGSTLTQKEIDTFKKYNAVLVCTLSPAMPMAKSLSEKLSVSARLFSTIQILFLIIYMIIGTKTALENGITVGLGTYTGCP